MPEEIRVPGGTAGLWIAAFVGFAATAIALGLTFVPPPGVNATTYEVNLIVQAAAMIGAGLILYRVSVRKQVGRRAET
jgi:hypothetical protein